MTNEIEQYRGIKDESQKCFICGRQCENRRSLGNHVSRSHHEYKGLELYTLKYVLKCESPKCKCGCGKTVLWNKSGFVYNDFVNGHNITVVDRSSMSKPSREAIDHRIEKIKEAYSQRGDVIREKISKSVKEGLHSSSFDFSEHHRRNWSNEEFRKKQKDARVRSWACEEGEKRRQNVFTPEFGKKISIANSSREMKTTSAEEIEFGEMLKRIFGESNVHRHKSFDCGERCVIPDFWIESEDLCVEYDGVFWHGLDRNEDFSVQQIRSIVNDLKKNRVYKESGLSCVRLRSDVDWKSIDSLSSLISASHHHISKGVVLKEGTIKFSDDQKIMKRESVIKMNMKESIESIPGREFVRKEILPLIVTLVQEHTKYWDWFYPPEKEDISIVLSKLKDLVTTSDTNEKSEFLLSSRIGSSWLKSKSVSFWNSEGGPVAATQDIKKLTSVVSYRLGLNNSKLYTYKMSDGSEVQTNETFDISLYTIRDGLITQKNSVSWFKPSVAADIYSRFLSGIHQPVVWDPSGGFGARMVGFSAVFPESIYICNEPAKMTSLDLEELSECISSVHENFCCIISKQGSEKEKISPESVDLVFTSPPYFDKEKYFDEDGQCWKDYSDKKVWIEKYLLPTIQTAFSSLKVDRHMVLNVSNELSADIISIATSVGFKHISTLRLRLGSDNFARKLGRVENERSEPVLIFVKE